MAYTTIVEAFACVMYFRFDEHGLFVQAFVFLRKHAQTKNTIFAIIN